jgi:aryl-alcohol dehydrogenase-like predicted oxidoreductase
MEYRKLGTGLREVSVVSLGTWAMSGEPNVWGQVDDNESIATIVQALDLGVNLIDTAPTYGAGHGEEIVGKAIADRRASVLVMTKCGLVPAGRSKTLSRRLTRDSIIGECEASLRRLRTDYIDLYLCHWPDPATPISETMSALRQLREQGKVRAIGLSNYSCEEAAAALEFGPVHALQHPFSILQRRAEEDVLPFCRERDIAALAYGPLAKGLLTGKFAENSRITGIRATDPEFMGARYRRNLARVAKLTEMAAKYHRTAAQLAIQWVIQHAGVTSAVVGAKRPSQLVENVGAVGWCLDPEDVTAIESLLAGP